MFSFCALVSFTSDAVPQPADVGPLIARVGNLTRTVDDMVRLDDVCEGSVLHCVASRFLEEKIYTNIGTILVSVNP
jgi:myosin heavy subunit